MVIQLVSSRSFLEFYLGILYFSVVGNSEKVCPFSQPSNSFRVNYLFHLLYPLECVCYEVLAILPLQCSSGFHPTPLPTYCSGLQQRVPTWIAGHLSSQSLSYHCLFILVSRSSSTVPSSKPSPIVFSLKHPFQPTGFETL